MGGPEGRSVTCKGWMWDLSLRDGGNSGADGYLDWQLQDQTWLSVTERLGR